MSNPVTVGAKVMQHFKNSQVSHDVSRKLNWKRETDCLHARDSHVRYLLVRVPASVGGRIRRVYQLCVDNNPIATFEGPRAAMRYAAGAVARIEDQAK